MVDPVPGRHLLIASTGGHLAQLNLWSKKIGSASDSLWVTFDSPQSRSLLADRRTIYVPYIKSRDAKATFHAFRKVMSDVDWRREALTAAVSTGSAVGVAGLLAARLHRVPSFYIESVSRVLGPSMSGKLVSLDPGIHKSCQYRNWAGGRWHYRGSLLEDVEVIPREPAANPRLFITLGTIRPYRFDSLVNAVLAKGLADDRTVWQLGETTRRDLPGTVYEQLRGEDFDRFAREADVVITHSGVGTILHMFDMGIFPVVVPRRQSRNEMVDDHQLEIAALLKESGVAAVREVEELDRDTIRWASEWAIRPANLNLPSHPEGS